tara:strand:+ start:1296 stop:1631 length:336 start_codon:yes stop_codon:yes gene_type:complete
MGTNKFFFLILCVCFFIQCSSIDSLENSDNIYIGMSISSFCDAVSMTWINDDPCFGNQSYDYSNNAMILSASNSSKFFVFTSVTNPDMSSGQLSLITSSISEAEFYLNNIN